MAQGAKSFATFLILCPTSFFLGILFSFFPYDFPVLWTSTPATAEFYTQLETHLQFIHSAPPIIPRILHIVIAVGLLGFFIKLYKPSEANALFDGASLVLYMVGITVYVANIVKGLRVVSAGEYGKNESLEGDTAAGKVNEGAVVGREDSLRVLAASNTILALVLVGVLVLQAGQWYAERKEKEEVEKMNQQREEKARGNGRHTSPTGGGKKKQ